MVSKLNFIYFQAALAMQIAMDNEAKLTSGQSGAMVMGEPPSPIITANGVNKVSCIDPKSDATGLDGFALPKSMGDDVPDGGCTGAQVLMLILILNYDLDFS